MKTTAKFLLFVLALGLVNSGPMLRAQDDTITVSPPLTGDQPAPPAAGKAGKGGRAGQMNPDQRVAELDKALSLTADQTTKIKDIFVKAAAKVRSLPAEERRTKAPEILQTVRADVRAVLTAEQQKKFDAMPQGLGSGRGRGKKGA